MRRTIDIAPAAIFKVLAAIVLVWLWLKLWPLLIVLVMAAVLAIAFEPLVARLESWRIPRGLAAFGCVTLFAATVVAFFWAGVNSVLIFCGGASPAMRASSASITSAASGLRRQMRTMR